jgi:DNA-binding HxlR family transcriptional regulator
MALPNDYAGQACSLARTLEIVGERWTLLIVRDAFFGVRRFGDFAAHLGIPRAVLTERLKSLTAAGVLARVPAGPAAARGHPEYELTAKGVSLWAAVRALTAWGDEHYAPAGPRRLLWHADDEGPVDASGRCTRCGASVPARDTVVAPGPGLDSPGLDTPGLERAEPAQDAVSKALTRPHRLLEPLRHA